MTKSINTLKYLDQLEVSNLIREAERQSLLVSNTKNCNDEVWELNNDYEGWILDLN